MVGPFRRVLVGWDGSPDSVQALNVAAEIAGRDGGHVGPCRGPPGAMPVPTMTAMAARQPLRAWRRRGSSSCAAIVGRHRQLALMCWWTAGTALDVRYAYAAEHGFDLLILGGTVRRAVGGRASARCRRGGSVQLGATAAVERTMTALRDEPRDSPASVPDMMHCRSLCGLATPTVATRCTPRSSTVRAPPGCRGRVSFEACRASAAPATCAPLAGPGSEAACQ